MFFRISPEAREAELEIEDRIFLRVSCLEIRVLPVKKARWECS